jgi:oligosaccharyltransferase complex subunit delta (ribophorin II)
MKFFISVIPSLLISSVSVVSAASFWSFEDATLSVQTKGAGIGAGAKEK